jgi:3-oxoacyl-[acyl-carrier-protein] synthase III
VPASTIRSRIASTGMYVPSRVVTNRELEKLMDTSDEWIQQRSGIKERRWVGKEDTTLSMGVAAAKQALAKAKLQADDIDLIIFGALITDYVFPGTGVMIQRELGFSKPVPALDIRNQCSGFIYAVSLANAWIQTGQYKRILIVGSEIHSTSLDITTRGRDVSVLFGDGAGAAIVEACDGSVPHIIDSVLHSEGKYAESLTVAKPSPNDHPRLTTDAYAGLDIYPYMDGKLVFKNAVTRMTEVIHEILERNKLKPAEIDFVVAHQANMRINQMVLDQIGIPFEKTHHTLDRYGNTTMATIPITFDEAVAQGKVKRGDCVLFVAFGAGFTWGANLLKY